MQQPVRLFGPGLSSTGIDAILRIDGGAARIDQPDVMVPFDRMRVRGVGFATRGVEIAWDDDKGAWALQVLEPSRARAVLIELEAVAPRVCGDFAGRPSRCAQRARFSWIAVALLLLPVLAMVAFFALLDPIANLVTARVSQQAERQLGDESFRSLRPRLRLRDGGDSGRVVSSIGQKLTRGSRYRYAFHVTEDPAVNAFALPGGIIVVNTGLIAATECPEELAGVLAHEIEHVELRHSLRQMIKQLGLSATLALFMGDIGAGRVAEQLVGLKFTRDAERQADEQAVTVLTRSGVDPTGLPRFFRRLHTEPAPPSWLSSHPTSADRELRLAAVIRSRGALRTAPLEYGHWPPAATQP